MNYIDFEIKSKNDWNLFGSSSVYEDITRLIDIRKKDLIENLLSTMRECNVNEQLSIQYMLGSYDALTEFNDMIKTILDNLKEEG